MENTFPLDGHSFTASTDMKSFYVIRNTGAGAPEIIHNTDLGIGKDNGLSLELVAAADGSHELMVTPGNAFTSRIPEMIHLGSLQIEEHSYSNGQARHEVTAFLSCAYVKNAQMVFTVGGIGITDIISADPLKVTLINAPLDQMAIRGGGTRPVMGVLIDVFEMMHEDGPSPNRIWEVSVALNGLELGR